MRAFALGCILLVGTAAALTLPEWLSEIPLVEEALATIFPNVVAETEEGSNILTTTPANLETPETPPLTIPYEPELYQDCTARCFMSRPPKFIKGGQLAYALLSDISELWKHTNDPPIPSNYDTRNLPFYNIRTQVRPEASIAPHFTESKMMAYLIRVARGLAKPGAAWVEMTCQLLYRGGQHVGMMKISEGAGGSSLLRRDEEVQRRGGVGGRDGALEERRFDLGRNGSQPVFVGTKNLGALNLNVHFGFTGKRTTDRNALPLFLTEILKIMERDAKAKLTWPKSADPKVYDDRRVIFDEVSPDRTTKLSVILYGAAKAWGFTAGDVHEVLMQALLRCAVADRWESFGGFISNTDPQETTFGTFHMEVFEPGVNGEGEGQNYVA